MAESGWCLGESQGCPEGWTKIWKHGKIYLVGSCFFLEGDSWCALLFQKNNHHSWVRFTPIGGGLVSQLVPKWTCRPGDPGSKGAGKGRGMAQCWLRWTFFGTQIVRQRKSTTLVEPSHWVIKLEWFRTRNDMKWLKSNGSWAWLSLGHPARTCERQWGAYLSAKPGHLQRSTAWIAWVKIPRNLVIK